MNARERRTRLARDVIAGSIRAYDMALDQTYKIRDVFNEYWPISKEGNPPATASEADERKAWLDLILMADQAFDAAEVELATAIQNLWDWIAPEAERIGRSAEGWPDYGFAVRAVSSGGRRYILTYNVEDYDPETNIIAVIGPGRTLDLDRA